MSDADLTEQLTKLLSLPPSSLTWRRVCACLGLIPKENLEKLLPSIEEKLSFWPDALRVSPVSWWLRALAELGNEGLRACGRLVRSLSLDDRHSLIGERLSQILWYFPNLTELSLSHIAEDDLLETLAAQLQLKTLRLSRCPLGVEENVRVSFQSFQRIEVLEVIDCYGCLPAPGSLSRVEAPIRELILQGADNNDWVSEARDFQPETLRRFVSRGTSLEEGASNLGERKLKAPLPAIFSWSAPQLSEVDLSENPKLFLSLMKEPLPKKQVSTRDAKKQARMAKEKQELEKKRPRRPEEQPLLWRVKSLRLERCALTDERLDELLERMESSPKEVALEALSLAENQVSSLGLRALCDASFARRLTSLDVSQNPIWDEVWRLEEMPKLTSLSLGPRLPSLEEANALLQAFRDPSLTAYDVLDTFLQEAKPPAYVEEVYQPLTKKRLSEPQKSALVEATQRRGRALLSQVCGLLQRHKLSSLGLRRLSLSRAEDVQALLQKSAIERLDLGENLLEAKAVSSLFTEETGGLRSLSLSKNPLGDGGMVRPLKAGGLSSLEELYLSETGLTPGGLQRVLQSFSGGGLRRLELQKNKLGAEGLEVWAKSERVGPLEAISLLDCDIDEDALTILASVPHLASVRELDLRRNPLSVSGLCGLLQSSNTANLERLWVSLPKRLAKIKGEPAIRVLYQAAALFDRTLQILMDE